MNGGESTGAMETSDEDQFRRLCEELIAPKLMAHGFQSAGATQFEDKRGLRIRGLVYRRHMAGAEPLYIIFQLVTIRCHVPPDSEWVQVLLGEGDHEGIEADFNSISMWDVTNAVTGSVDTRSYLIRAGDTPASALEFAACELSARASDFLAGELDAFHRVRAERNSAPRNYSQIMYGPDGNELDEAARSTYIQSLESARRKFS